MLSFIREDHEEILDWANISSNLVRDTIQTLHTNGKISYQEMEEMTEKIGDKVFKTRSIKRI